MKNNVLVIILSVILVVLAGTTLLYFVGNVVSTSVSPLAGQLGESVALQKQAYSRSMNRNDSVILGELKRISDKLDAIEKKLSGGVAAAKAPSKPSGGGCGGGQAPEDAGKVYDIKVGDTPVMGNKKAMVTITSFMDLQCPFCTRFYPPMKELVKIYNGKVNFMMKNYPLSFHQKAVGAAKLAFAANEQGKYYEMVELLLNNGSNTTDEKIKEYAQSAGLNYKKLVDDFKNKDAVYQKRLDADKALAEQSSINGTPTFYINGKKTSARDVEAYKIEIDKILAAKK